MNLGDLEERCWQELGFPASTDDRKDWRRQVIRDEINNTIRSIGRLFPFAFSLVRESTLALTAGANQTYTLDDWCRFPLSFYTQDTNAHKVKLRIPRIADRLGIRGSNYNQSGNGPYDIIWAPKTTIAYKSGAAASATELAQIITGLAGTVAGDANRMIRLNGEDADYKIISQSGGNQYTVDKAIRARLTGVGVTGLGVGYAGVRWEVSPPGRFQISVPGGLSSATTLYYRGVFEPRRLINSSETPEVEDTFHDLIWMGAVKRLANTNEDNNAWQRWKTDYQELLEELKASDRDEWDSEDSPDYESLLGDTANMKLPVDTYVRGQGDY